MTIHNLAELVLKATGSKSEIRRIPYSEAYPSGFEDMQRRVPDITRINALIGFRPTRSLETILADVIEEQKVRLQGTARTRGEQQTA